MRRLTFICLLALCTVGAQPWKAFGQASAGYVKLTSTSGTSFIDSGVMNGMVYEYQITAFCAEPVAPATVGPCGVNSAGQPILGESTPLTSNPAPIPATGTHTVTIAWAASATPGVIYNIYKIGAVVPNPPNAPTSGGVATVN